MTAQLNQIIVSDPKIRGGKPCIAGHRIAVHDLAVWYEQMGMSVDEIAVAYDLALSDVFVGLGYYFANKESIDHEIQAAKAEIVGMQEQNNSILQEKLNELTH
ncbi:MAG: DUF433 domain-containing protein [Bacteroidota bacterium]